jgi:hypothetical protein
MRRLQDATLWIKGAPDIFGKPQWNGPHHLKVRWEDVNELFIGNDGKEQRSRSRIYLDRRINVGDYLMEGVSQNATPPAGLSFEVKAYRKIPNLSSTKVEHRVML